MLNQFALSVMLLPLVFAQADETPQPGDTLLGFGDRALPADGTAIPHASPVDASVDATTATLAAPADVARDSGRLRPRSTTDRPSPTSSRAARRDVSAGLVDLWPLAVVLAMIVVGAWFLRRMQPRSRALAGSAIEVLGRTHLSAKQSLALVRVGQRLLVIGITPDHISSIGNIDDPEDVAALMTAGRSRHPFKQAMTTEQGAYDTEPASELLVPDVRTDVKSLLKRVRELKSGA